MQIGVETSRAVENKRIFVVESDEIIRSALQFMLHDENETHEFAEPEQAYVKGMTWRPDVLLLGIGIVQDKGLAVLAEIAARLPSAKILLVADSAADALVQDCLQAGASDVLSKPITVESVRDKVDVLLGRSKAPLISLVLVPVAG